MFRQLNPNQPICFALTKAFWEKFNSLIREISSLGISKEEAISSGLLSPAEERMLKLGETYSHAKPVNPMCF